MGHDHSKRQPKSAHEDQPRISPPKPEPHFSPAKAQPRGVSSSSSPPRPSTISSSPDQQPQQQQQQPKEGSPSSSSPPRTSRPSRGSGPSSQRPPPCTASPSPRGKSGSSPRPSRRGVNSHRLHVLNCQCRVCSPRLYSDLANLVARREGVDAWGDFFCPDQCECFACRSGPEWREAVRRGCITDGHKLASESRCSYRNCQCTVGCKDATNCPVCREIR